MIVVQRIPRGLRAPLVAALALVVLLASFGAALRQDPFAFLFPFGRGPGLDYSHGPTGLVPLDDRFISDILGEDEPARASRVRADERQTPPPSSFDPPQRLTDRHPLTNDDRADARAIPAVPFTARTDTTSASREPDEPGECSEVGGGTVWYRYTPPRELGFIANTFGSSYSTTLGVFETNDEGSLSAVACDLDLNGNSMAQFAAEAGTTYLFQISGPAGGGALTFSLDPLGTTELATDTATDEPGNSWSEAPSMSADGRFVAFRSATSNLAPGTDPMPCATHDDIDTQIGRHFVALFEPGEPCAQAIVLDRATGAFTIASVNDAGEPANGSVYHGPMISGDGRSVTFASVASNLVDENGDGRYDDKSNIVGDIYVHDLITRHTERVSLTHDDRQIAFEPVNEGPPHHYAGTAFGPVISNSGRHVAFFSPSSILVEGDTNGTLDVFVRDRLERTTERVSVSSDGAQSNGDSVSTCISPSGRFVAFASTADNLVPGDTNEASDVFVHDRWTGITTRESVASDGSQGNDSSEVVPGLRVTRCFSDDGRFLAFSSAASNLVPGDTNSVGDVFVRDRLLGTTQRVSVSSAGGQSRWNAGLEVAPALDYPRNGLIAWGRTTPTGVGGISSDGRYVVFDTQADGLVAEDENGTFDVFVHDRLTATTIRVSVNTKGEPLLGDSAAGAFSADGRIIAFDSSPQLTSPPPPPHYRMLQIYVHERFEVPR